MENAVGPVLRMCDEVDSVVAAIEEDNPGQEITVVDRGAYVRVHTQYRMVVTEATLKRHLGESFHIRSLEGMLSSFAGRIRTSSDNIIWETQHTSPRARRTEEVV